jgi:hypoxanthine-guanine phosphoribosyltransferase
VRKKKSVGAMPSVAKKLEEMEEKFKNRDVLTLRDLIDEGKEVNLINQYLEDRTIAQHHHAVMDTASQGVVDIDVDVDGQQARVACC